MYVTKHAKKRVKERVGVSKTKADKMAKMAIERGVERTQTKGRLRKWVDSQFYKNPHTTEIYIYGDKAYIFIGEGLITVLQIPSDLTRDIPNMIKK